MTVGGAEEVALETLMQSRAAALVEPLGESCGECHRAELEVWKRTRHATGFADLHQEPRAQRIAEEMGIPLVKRDSVCLGCHFTPVAVEDDGGTQLRAAHGVSCQSCHGPARDWINVHNDYGVAERDFQRARALETPAHRAQRLAQSTANGMRRASDLYAIAAACFGCHIVAVEALVNGSSHRTGSEGFELANWSHSRMRHNFLESYLTGDGTSHAEMPPERQRLMYVIGRLLELEFGIRAFAMATEYGRYYRSLKRRVETTILQIELIAGAESIREVDEVLTIVAGLPVELGHVGRLLEAADRIAAAAKRFAGSQDGARLGELDAMIAESHEFLPLFSR